MEAEEVRRWVVSRISVWSEEKQPCEDAYQATYTRVDYRTGKSHSAMQKVDPCWLDKGENHRCWHGGVCRDFPGEEAWFIDIPNLAALESFITKHGRVVIGAFQSNVTMTEIEIYDDYRE